MVDNGYDDLRVIAELAESDLQLITTKPGHKKKFLMEINNLKNKDVPLGKDGKKLQEENEKLKQENNILREEISRITSGGFKIVPTTVGSAIFDIRECPTTITTSGGTATYIGPGATGWVTFQVLPSFRQHKRKVSFFINQIGSGGMFIGIGHEVQKGMNAGCGSTPSWGYMSSGLVYIVGESTQRKIAPYFKGDTISIELNKKNEIVFVKNGEQVLVVSCTTPLELWPEVTFYSTGDCVTLL